MSAKMGPPPKSKGSLAWLAFSEALSLVTLIVAAVFFITAAVSLYLYAKWSVLFGLSVASALACIYPLILFFPERFARTIHYCGLSKTAEPILRWSLENWKKLVGENGLGVTGKMSQSAQFYLEQGRLDLAESLYKSVQQRVDGGRWFKFPSRAETSLNVYRNHLQATGDFEKLAEYSATVSRLKKRMLPSMILFVLMPLPVVAYFSCSEVLIRTASINLRSSQAEAFRQDVKRLADVDSFFFGRGSGARVYSDYSMGLYDAPEQESNAQWLAEAGLRELKPGQMNVVASRLHFVLATVYLLKGLDNQALQQFRLSVELAREGEAQAPKDALSEAYVITAMTGLGDLYVQAGRMQEAEGYYEDALQRLQKIELGTASDDQLGLLDRLSSLQSGRGAFADAVSQKQLICRALEQRLTGIAVSSMNPDQVEQHRRLTREMDACSMLLKQLGDTSGSADLAARADKMRTERVRPLSLNLQQQREIVDATTRATEHLLSVKYKTNGWQKNLELLLEKEMKSSRAKGALDALSWLTNQTKNDVQDARKIEIDILPMKVRNFREPNTLAVDVRGTVHISGKSPSASEQFAFAYLLKSSGQGPPTIDAVAEN